MLGYSLPIEKYRNELVGFIEKNKNVIIKGSTGCGKSTFIPLLLKDKKVAIIEPRRIAVTALYNILKEQIPTLGYKMRFSRVLNRSTTMTIFTDGAFLNDLSLMDYDYIIVDEVHERSLRTDILLGILKKSYTGKVILMSATLDTKKFETFFSASTFLVSTKTYPLKINYLPKPTSDYITECYLTLKKLVSVALAEKENVPRDILVFLPGEEDIGDVYELCKRIPGISLFKVYSRLDDGDQRRIFEPSLTVRVILSTNICESSLTIPNIKYVIDTGLCKIKVYDGINRLGITSVSKESAIQRRGRANRLGPGECFCLYPEFLILPSQVPEIKRADLSSTLLMLIGSGIDILKFPFIDFPPVDNCIYALSFLCEKKCIGIFYKKKKVTPSCLQRLCGNDSSSFDLLNNISFNITSYGKKLVRHPFDVHIAHFYEMCLSEGCGQYGSLLISLISQENYSFLTSPSEKTDIQRLVDLMDGYLKANNRKDYASKNNVPYKGLEGARKIYKTLSKTPQGSTLQKLEIIFSNAFSHNLCENNGDGSYTHLSSQSKIFIHPSSSFFKRREKKIVVVSFFESSKTYARIVGKFYETSKS